MSLQWHYLDSQGSEFGPFDGEKMRRWFDQGYFQVAGDNLLVRLPEWRSHRRLTELYYGDRAAYFLSPPRQGENATAPQRDRSRSPHRPAYGEAAYGSTAPAPGQYPPSGVPPPGAAPGPYGAPPWPPLNGYPPPSPYGAPPPGPWSHPPPYGGPGPPPPAYGWGHPPPMGGHPGYGYWPPPHGPHPGYYGYPPPPGVAGPYARPPAALRDRDDDSDDDRDRGRGRGGGGGSKASAAEAAARAAEEQAEELRRLGRDGLRELLTSTLESLYKDRIKPMANYVKGRLKERNSIEAVVKQFVDLYGQHSDLFRVQPGAAGDEAAIFLVADPPWFKGWVDIDSSEDPYDEDMWRELKNFLDNGGHTFAGGRYGMARELMQRNLPFLSTRSLGEICHIVQLAIQQRKIIVYHKKMLKPMQPSLCAAAATAPAGANGGGGGAGADLEDIKDLFQLCKVLFKTLKSHPNGIRLDRMKQLIKEECSCRLNEMAFQCTKLIELFRQEPLRSTFALENDGKAFVLRLGDPKLFSERVRSIHAEVFAGGDSRR